MGWLGKEAAGAAGLEELDHNEPSFQNVRPSFQRGPAGFGIGVAGTFATRQNRTREAAAVHAPAVG